LFLRRAGVADPAGIFFLLSPLLRRGDKRRDEIFRDSSGLSFSLFVILDTAHSFFLRGRPESLRMLERFFRLVKE
jgi:hypothetical protein